MLLLLNTNHVEMEHTCLVEVLVATLQNDIYKEGCLSN